MSFFTRIFSASTRAAFNVNGRNLTAETERKRFAGTMPGEMGARAGARFGMML